MDVLKKYSIVEQIGLTFDIYVPRVCLFITILTYVLLGNNIDAEKVFMTSAFYTVLKSSMTIGFALSKLFFNRNIFYRYIYNIYLFIIYLIYFNKINYKKYNCFLRKI